MQRRHVLRAALTTVTVAALGTLGIRRADAAWAAAAFDSRNVADALRAAFGTDAHVPSDLIVLKAPNLAENGATVPFEVSTSLAGAESISFLVEGNQNPLAARFRLTPGSGRTVSTRLKLGRSSGVLVIVRADGKLYSARKEVGVTIGGCGG